MRTYSKKLTGSLSAGFLASGFLAAGFLMLTAAAAVAPAHAQTAEPVFAVTHLDVSVGAVPQGIEIIKKFREASRREDANLEFTIMQEVSRPNRLAIMEGWRDKAAFDAHDKGAAKAEFEGALKAIRNSPPDRKMLQPFANTEAKPLAAGALYLLEHVDFLGGDPSIATTAMPLVTTLADASKKEASALRYDVYRMPAPRINHYEVVAAWTDAKALDAHEKAAHTLAFRNTTAQGSKAWRANMYDQRLYNAL
jgi:quinol monooxygenase YgiN